MATFVPRAIFCFNFQWNQPPVSRWQSSLPLGDPGQNVSQGQKLWLFRNSHIRLDPPVQSKSHVFPALSTFFFLSSSTWTTAFRLLTHKIKDNVYSFVLYFFLVLFRYGWRGFVILVFLGNDCFLECKQQRPDKQEASFSQSDQCGRQLGTRQSAQILDMGFLLL